jgi:predicted small lipoprotein YifL
VVRIIALVCVVCGCGGGGGEDMPDAAVSPDSKQETCSFVDDFTGTLLRPDWRLNVYGPQLNVTI